MSYSSISGRRVSSAAWPAAFLGVGAVAAAWFWLAPGGSVPGPAATAAVAAAALVGLVWQSRARSAGRLRSALDAYAEQEIARGVPRNRHAANRV
jgi:hypothetical protein